MVSSVGDAAAARLFCVTPQICAACTERPVGAITTWTNRPSGCRSRQCRVCLCPALWCPTVTREPLCTRCTRTPPVHTVCVLGAAWSPVRVPTSGAPKKLSVSRSCTPKRTHGERVISVLCVTRVHCASWNVLISAPSTGLTLSVEEEEHDSMVMYVYVAAVGCTGVATVWSFAPPTIGILLSLRCR